MKLGKGLVWDGSRSLLVSRFVGTVGLTGLVGLVTGCGDEDKSGGGNFADIAKALERPTGELAKDNAKDIAVEFEKASSSSASGGSPVAASKRLLAGSSQSQACPNGGKINITADSNSDSAHVSYSYDNCCYSSASCCMDGGGEYYYATEGGSAYTMCISMSLDYDCGDILSGGASYSGCIGANGWTYSVEIKGKTFAVSGSLRNGSGTLTIVDAKTEWSCTYTNYEGSCKSGSTTVSF